ncbi:MAG: phosphotransferase [Candidatus Korobacteraceae bacterium]
MAVPGSGEPRWLLPQGVRNIDSVLSSWSPYLFSSRLKWKVIRAASRSGAVQLLPNSTAMESPNATVIDWRSLGWNRTTPPVPVIYVGTPGISRKAVIHLVDRASGHGGAIVKVPLAEGAKPAILLEADLLAALAEENCSCAPHLLSVNRLRGIATQTFVPGTSGDRRSIPESCHLLRSLMLGDETTTMAQYAAGLQEHTQWPEAFESHDDTLSAVLSELCDTLLLPACWVHGDFAPWNIKRRPDRTWLLIDWEDAQRGGLPLHDYYHFLHIQDYLFGHRATSHSAAAEHFAQTLGIATPQCRKLEIAYLAGSYLKCKARQEDAHANFLLTTIQVALEARPRPVIVPRNAEIGMPAGDGQAAGDSSQIRAQLFVEMIAQLNSAGIRYCVLGGYRNDPDAGAPDVDVMVHPRDMRQLPSVLERTARIAGGQLIQAIQHETTGCYFILAKPDGDYVGFLDPDCCSDYRRQGRLWLPAEEVIAGRRPYQDFYVPSIPDQFTYYLLKKILKQSLTADQLRRLQNLYTSQPAECQGRLSRFWPPATALEMQRALIDSNLSWFQARRKNLLLELRRSAPVESWLERSAGKLRNLGRRVRRALHPTGMWVLVAGGEAGLASKVADGLLQSLAPAFRWTDTATVAHTVASSLSQAARIFCARRQSTLVVSTGDLEPRTIGLYSRRLQFCSMLTRFLSHPDLVLLLKSGSDRAQPDGGYDAACPEAMKPYSRTIHLDANSSAESLIAEGRRAVLDWLASRLKRRLALPGLSDSAVLTLDPVAESVELRSAGLD